MKKKDQQPLGNVGFSTRAIRDQMPQTAFREHSAPLFLSSSFTFPDAENMAATFAGEADGIIYSRYNNPNLDELIAKVCHMEGAEAGFATASGMSAVFGALMAFLRAGDHILSSRAVFGSTHQILTQLMPRWQIGHTYVDPTNPDTWSEALRPASKVFLVETPSNPGLALVDLAAAGRFAREHDLILMVDNCFATPYLQRPMEFGAHLVIHSATKWMDGQGRVLGGLIVGEAQLMEEVIFYCRHTGPAMSPFHAWLLSKSLETLAIRLDAHCRHALRISEWMLGRPEFAAVNYPFLTSHPQYALAQRQMEQGGGLVTFTLAGGASAAMDLIDRVRICSRTSNLGDSRTILTHPASTTHSKLSPAEQRAVGITPGLVRMSVGLEDPADIIADLEQALTK